MKASSMSKKSNRIHKRIRNENDWYNVTNLNDPFQTYTYL